MRPLLLQQARKRRECPCRGESAACRTRRRDNLRLPQIDQRRGDRRDECEDADDSPPIACHRILPWRVDAIIVESRFDPAAGAAEPVDMAPNQ
jgi:hypothetical protein